MSAPTPTPGRRRVKKRVLVPLVLLGLVLALVVWGYVRGTWADSAVRNPQTPGEGAVVQLPQELDRVAVVTGGAQGIGKDSLLAPIKFAIGPWNFAEVSPAQLLGRCNSFVRSVILRVSEARDLGDVHRQVAHPLQLADHPKSGDDHPEVAGDGLLEGQQGEAVVLDPLGRLVDLGVGADDLLLVWVPIP